jgi:nuclear transport factor 2 (NTF2) superfamily protein
MRVVLPKKYYYERQNGEKVFQGWTIFVLRIKRFAFRWFTDCGEWFIYLEMGKRNIRFSSCGYLNWKDK